MNKRYLVFIVIVVALAAGAWLVFGNKEAEAPAPQPSAQQQTVAPSGNGDQLVVAITDNGFSPQTLAIRQGQTVTFTNASDRPAWPASDVHPSHNVLPDFDARRGLQPGETYQFTFDRPGEWGFHDHLNASNTGVIVVE